MSDAVLIGHHEPGTPEWHAARRDGLGGSEIAAVMGLSPFESPFSLWHRKRGQIGPVPESDEMYWGKALEAVIADEYELRHLEVRRVLDSDGMYRNLERHWQIAQPDRWYASDEGPRLLEVKTARYDDGWGEPGTGEVPVYYRAQCLWYLDTLGLERCDVAVLITGSDYREYRITTLDDGAAADIHAMQVAAREFIQSIRDNQRPDIDAHSATYQAVRELHPEIEPTTVDLPADVALAYLDALGACKDADAAKREATARVADAMGSAHKARHIDQIIATRRTKNGGTPYVQAVNGLADQHRSAA